MVEMPPRNVISFPKCNVALCVLVRGTFSVSGVLTRPSIDMRQELDGSTPS